jgi:hypothetical protein
MSSPLDAIYLTDAQHEAIARAAAALMQPDRGGFIDALANRLHGETTIGDGSLFRVIKDVLALGCYRSMAGPVRGSVTGQVSKLAAGKPVA